jgi:hypothetical protein
MLKAFTVLCICLSSASLCVCFFSFVASGQQKTTTLATTSSPLIEVIATDYQVWSSYKFLFLRVFPDGKAEYNDIRRVDLTRPPVILRKTVSAEVMSQLATLISETGVRKLDGVYSGNIGKDTSLKWDITLSRVEEKQKITWFNFTYGLDEKPKRPIPNEAIELGCVILKISDHLRGSLMEREWLPDQCKKPTPASQ